MKNQVFYAVQICFKYEDDMVIMFKKYENALARYQKECQGYAGIRTIVLKKFDLSIRGWGTETTIEKNEVI